MVTTSYISPAMRELDAAAKQAGVVILIVGNQAILGQFPDAPPES